MSDEIVNDGQRYSVLINEYFHQQSYVVYAAIILDQCFNYQYKICFRYKSLKNIHQKLIKTDRIKHLVPQFPKTRSFFFVNRTNRSSKNIQDRARQLEYYVSKLLNTKFLSNTNQVKNILSIARNSFLKTKSKSETKLSNSHNNKTSSLSKTRFKSYNKPFQTKDYKYL